LAELDRLVRRHFRDRGDAEPVGMSQLLKRLRSGNVIVLDTRLGREYAAGHIAGAISVPLDELKARLGKLPKKREYVAYCGGPYNIYADAAAELLRKSGRKARRMMEGYRDWKAAGHPVAVT
jgi:rhodanese-related sulfurtransferase